jgi:hypothetical protein
MITPTATARQPSCEVEMRFPRIVT